MHNEVAHLSSSDSKKASETPKNNDSYNIKSMTKLNNENLDNKPLKECHISPKFFKQINGKERPNGTNNPKNGISNLENGDMDDKYLRKELGENIVNAVESYFKKCKKQYFKYLLYMNSTEYKDKIKSQIQHEMSVKNELLFRKDKLEEQTSSLLKANVSLLKARAAELGIKDLKSPHELIEYAKEILTEHEDLVQKIKTMQQKVDSLQSKNGKKLPESGQSEDRAQPKNSAIYSKLLNVIDPKKSNEAAKGLKMPPPSKKSESSELSAENNKADELKLPTTDARSVGSNETLTATERGDDDIDNDDDLMSDNNKEQDSNESANLDSSIRRGEADLNESKSKSSPTSSSSSKDDKAENNNNKKTAKASYDKFLPKDANKSGENLRNFKIPKNATNAKAKNKSPPRSPSSPNNSRKTSSEPNRMDKNKHKNEHSASHSPSSFSADNQHKYMHPKKKYMMENSSNSSNMSYSNNFKHSSDYNHHHNQGSDMRRSFDASHTDWGYDNRHGNHAFENYRNPSQNQISTSSSSSSNMSSSSSWSSHPRNSNNHYQSDYVYVNDSYHSHQRTQPFANTLVNPSSEGFANYAPNIGAKPTNSG